ncbi:hypothetical protein COLO4_17682 [Corchorus olitorius]|uniref:Uncharacterized protein n=1 Tax=Corchorus olitorius TaxID=93759 RepID=A0A1R3JBU5_9ROSI|nr:hypothetical protein COLO4_17682 [Corchorus olitorius]
MEDPEAQLGEDAVEKPLNLENQLAASPAESLNKVNKSGKSSETADSKVSTPTSSTKKRSDTRNGPDLTSGFARSTISSSLRSSNSVAVTRRNSTGGVPEKSSVSNARPQNNASTTVGKKPTTPSATESVRRSLPELRRSSLPSPATKPTSRTSLSETRKSVPVSPVGRSLSTSTASDTSIQKTVRKSIVKPAISASSSLKKTTSSSVDSTASSTSRKTISKVSSPSTRSPTVSSGLRAGSLSSSLDRSSSLSGRKKLATPESRDSRFIVLPQVEIKAGDDVFVYLRDNLLSTLEGVEILTRVKVLDLSFNDFKGPGFEPLENCKALQVLAASKNRISTLKGFPYLPVLEHLRVEENPILKMPHLEAASILLVGPTLKKFNDRDLSRDELALAKRYPAQTALCIRDGWEFCRPEHAADSTFRFLFEQWKDHFPPGYLLKEASVDKPFEEDACRCHFSFVQESTLSSDLDIILKYKWFLGERTLSSFTAIPDADGEVYWPKHEDIGKILKVECTPVLGETEYPPIFAVSSPVARGNGIPKVVNVEVHGELVEGSIIKGHAKVAWCGGTPGKGVASWLRRRWNSSPVVIAGAEDEEYRLTIDDIDSSLVFMYTPVTEEGAKGEPQYKYTDFVKAAPPSVSNVRIIGDIVEGNVIKGAGNYFGGKEGPSKFEWLRENKETGDFLLVTSGTPEYTLTKEDVGRRLAFSYIPINFEGQEGESVSVVSGTVRQAPPKVTNVKIIGDLRENSKITVTGIVTGGTEGSSRVQWFKSNFSTFNAENDLEAMSTSKVAKAFRIPLGAVGYYIVAKYTPMTPDGESGEPVENDTGTLIHEVSGLLQYRVTKDAIGRFISFECTPVRDDGIVGEPRTCLGQERVRPGSPRLLALQITGNAVEGTILSVDKKYWGGEEGDSIFRWFRTSSDGSQCEIRGADASSYMLSVDDIGFFISVSCEPVRSDWARGPIVLSEQIGPIVAGPPTCQSLEFLGSMMEGQRLSFIASYTGGERGDCFHEWFRVKNNGVKEKLSTDEFLDLTLDDVGRRIQLVYTPMRKDGAKGNPRSIISDEISPADPVGLDLVIPDCHENQEVIPQKTYFGGREGAGAYTWYRTDVKPNGLYTPSLEDVGAYLALQWVPTRVDGRCGKPLVAISDSPVFPAPPVVSSVRVEKLASGRYSGEGEYSGGYEGSSLFSWYRETNDGTIILINGANSKTYEVTDEDYNSRLLFGYTPVRSDSVVGELRLSEPTEIVLPELLMVEMLALTGKAIEGDVLTAVEVIPKSEIQQSIWSKYKKDVRYQWFFTPGTGDSKSFEPLPSQRSCSFKVRFEDIGRCLKCECIVTDVFGRSSEPAYAETAPVLPGEMGRMYEANVDDVGYRLVAVYTPVREDGIEGQPVSASTEPIAVEPDVYKEVKQKIDLGSVKFEVLCDKDRNPKKVAGEGCLERRILEINRKRVKVVKPGSKTSFPTTEIRGTYAPPFHVETFRNDQRRLRIVVDSENEVDLMVHSRHLRDVIVLVIRGLAQRFNSTSLNSLLKIET